MTESMDMNRLIRLEEIQSNLKEDLKTMQAGFSRLTSEIHNFSMALEKTFAKLDEREKASVENTLNHKEQLMRLELKIKELNKRIHDLEIITAKEQKATSFMNEVIRAMILCVAIVAGYYIQYKISS